MPKIENNLPFPMQFTTKESGENRKLLVKPIEITSRDNIQCNAGTGTYLIKDPNRVKLFNRRIYAEVKEQGHFHFYGRDFSGEYTMFGRRQSVDGDYIDILPKIRDAVWLPKLPKGTAISIELIYPGHPDSEVPTAIKSCPDKLQIKGLGVPIFQGSDLQGNDSLPYLDGRKLLLDLLPPEKVVKYFASFELQDKITSSAIFSALLDAARIKKIEGFVLKERAYDGWWKLKGIKEADVYITGFKISKSDTRGGMITSVSIGCENKDLGWVTGFNEIQMQQMTDEFNLHGDTGKNKFKGRVIRIIYQEMASKGKLKHGFFDGWREDKCHWECSMEQFQ